MDQWAGLIVSIVGMLVGVGGFMLNRRAQQAAAKEREATGSASVTNANTEAWRELTASLHAENARLRTALDVCEAEDIRKDARIRLLRRTLRQHGIDSGELG